VYRIDCHVHPEYSPDAEGKICDYCEQALSIGLDALCFTTHVDLCDEPVVVVAGERIQSSDRRWLDAYCLEIEEARREYAGRGLTVLTGVEADFFPGCEQPLRELLAGAPLDFVMGSVHYVGEHVLTQRDSAIDYYHKTTMDEMAERYYEAVARAAGCGLFDAMGHLDIYRRFGEPIYGPGVASIHRDYAEPALRAIAQAGIGIEVNTSAIRRGADEVYPGADLLKLCREAGIELVTIGSDAHTVDVLGSGLSEGYAALVAAGYDVMYTWEGRRPVPHPIR
jgi:histidinol-phosphatase (PHP family)